MTFNIKILDSNHKHVGDLMTATVDQIKNLLDKGMIIINRLDDTEITHETIMNMAGVSDGFVEM